MTAGSLRKIWPWIVPAAILVVLPWVFSSGFALTIMSQMGVLIIFALAYNMLLGQGGMLSFGHAIYFGLAGYFTIHFVNGIGTDQLPYFPVSLVPLVGGVVGLLFGVLVGFVSTRRAGTTFAMISLGFGEMVTALTLILIVVFNGEEGIQTDRVVGPEPLGITYGPDIQVYYLIAVWCLISIIAMYALTRTPFGRMSNAVRDNPERVQFVGYNTHRIRWLAFSLSSFFAGLAGALHALNLEHVGFETVSLQQSGLVLFMVYIGGVRHFIGPILGAVLITFLNGILSDLTEAWFLYLGVMFVTIVIFAPGGLAGLIMLHEPMWKADYRLFGRLLVPYAAAIVTSVITLIGVIGLVEMVYFLSTHITGETTLSLYGVHIDTSNTLPWLVCGVIGAVGILACRRTYPRMAASWNAAMDEVKARVAQ
ncbi:MAG: branched-chain amino acid ABC transporter permease [Candidatus Methylomirabilia bacterium]